MTRSLRQPGSGTSPARPAGGTESPAVRRGDLVVIHLRRRSWASTRPRDDDELWAGEVTSVTRDGRVRLYRLAGRFGWEPPGHSPAARGEPLPGPQLQRFWIVSARKADVPGALATAACHTWPGQEDHVRPYDTWTRS